jgi:predicted nucleic acid-binding protein
VTFFVDANVIVYSAVPGPFHEASLQVLRAVARGEAIGRTSTAVLEEVWHIELRGRLRGLDGLARRAYEIFTPLLPVTDAIFGRALALEDTRLGANDRLHAATCLELGMEGIVTADDDFEGLPGLRRIDPSDRHSLMRLLTGAG